jgi:hypothetical protein
MPARPRTSTLIDARSIANSAVGGSRKEALHRDGRTRRKLTLRNS